MDCYMYSAALYCARCGEGMRAQLKAAGLAPGDPDDEGSYDSDAYPKGPFADGGGEADSPQHCDECGEFLENPLTSLGREYVEEVCKEDLAKGRNDSVSLSLWASFYNISLLPDDEEE